MKLLQSSHISGVQDKTPFSDVTIAGGFILYFFSCYFNNLVKRAKINVGTQFKVTKSVKMVHDDIAENMKSFPKSTKSWQQ